MASPSANPVALVDVQDRWGDLTEAEQNKVYAWLDDAWALVLVHVPSVPQRLADGTLSRQVVVLVITQAVMRVLKNPMGVRQRSISIDDYSESETRDNSVSSGNLYLTPEEIALLRPAGARKHGSSTQLVRTPPYGGREDPYYRGWSDW